MKVTVSAGGLFHSLELARQLEMRGCLERVITGYPRFRVRGFGIPPEKVVALPLGQALYRAWRRLPAPLLRRVDPGYPVSELFDRRASRRLAGGDLLVGWSSFSLRTLREAKGRGMKTVLERGSCHIRFQRRTLEEEYERLGRRGVLPHPALVEKELREYREADFISVPSSFAAETFVREGVDREKLIRIPLGVDLRRFRQLPREDTVFRVVFAGSLCLRKGVHYLLRAFRELGLPGSELVLIGRAQGEIRPFLKRYAGWYRYLGSRPAAELHRHFSRGSVFVLPSLEEGLAMVQLQAMACGLPLICTPNTGGGDVVEEGREGYIVPVRDVEALKEKLLLLYRDRELGREMGERAKKKVRQGFSWDDYGSRVAGEYRRMLGEDGR